VRTPKAPAKRPDKVESWGLALRLTRFETGMSLLLLTVSGLMAIKAFVAGDQTKAQSTGRLFLSFWLSYYAVIFAAAPLYAYKSFATLRTDDEMQAAEAAAPREATIGAGL
jgi:hypothetical protein